MKIKHMLVGAVSTLALMPSMAVAETTLNALFMSQAAYSEDDVKAMTAAFESANPDVTVNLEFVPYEALHDKTIAAVAAGGDGYDVVLFDVIWPAEFAEGGFLTDVTDRVSDETGDEIFDGAWTTVKYNDRLYGMPWILDTKYLFYNREMLAEAGFDAPPSTWDEVLVQARAIKEAGIVEYPLVWSWSQSEAMICDFTTLAAAHGGSFFNDGVPSFNQGGAVQALDYMTRSLEEGLTNPASTEYFEEDVRGVFSNGDAAFALNWTYMNALVNDPAESQVAGQVGVIPAPGVTDVSVSSAVNGSMGLGIPSNSAHVEEAWDYISFITQQSVQEDYARLSLPVWKASYSVPAVVDGQEELVEAANSAIAVMTPRPLVASYTEVSSILQRNLHGALLGNATAQDALDTAATDVERIR